MLMRRASGYATLISALLIASCSDDSETATSGSGGSSTANGPASSVATGTFCSPGSVQPCYSGPAGTQGVGVCVAGTQTCNPQGTEYGLCGGDVVPSADNCVSEADEDCDGATPACTGALLDSVVVEGTVAEVYGLEFDAAGALYATGIFSGTMNSGSGPLTSAGDTDFFAVSFAPDMTASAGIRIGAGGHDEGLSLSAMPASGFAITGRANENVDFATRVIGAPPYSTFVGLFTQSMNIRWARGFTGGFTTYVREVSVNGTGRIAVVVSFNDTTVDVGAGPVQSAGTDAVVAVYDEVAATLVWSQVLSSPGNDQAENISIDDDGNVFVSLYHSETISVDGLTAPDAGRALLKLDSEGEAQWMIGSVGFAVAADGQGGAVYDDDGELRHVDATGVEIWMYPGVFGELARDAFGNTVAVRSTGMGMLSLVKLDPDGGLVFDNPLDIEVVRDVATDTQGRIAITGRGDSQASTSTIQWLAP